jgi:hypothetical protein
MDTCMARVVTTTETGAAGRAHKIAVAAERPRRSAQITFARFILCGALALLATSCGRDGANRMGASHDPSKPVQVENFSLGTRLGPNGGIATGAGEHAFSAGQLIYIAMELKNAPIGTQISVVWKGPGNTVLGQETKQVRPGQQFMNFAADSSSLPPAPKYQVEVLHNNKTLAQLEFELVMGST